ncbi:pyruvate, water dikinase regulatory protein [Anaerolineales bacterium HSG6]|nr:pyruvate, water dikinase regulatory protein [Anaerolineales bacterium HSG6]MDM8532838.1 pyruvate, water dikinase regulatory protein [Anaerolineales bacterium HSG25]
MNNSKKSSRTHTIYVLSGSIGTGGERLSRKVMSQFQSADLDIDLKRLSHIRKKAQIEAVIDKIVKHNGTIVNTLVNPDLSETLYRLAHKNQIKVIDLVTDFITHLSSVAGIQPVGKPGLYRKLHVGYFKRVEAIEFTLAHDDGMNYQNWSKADVILTGLSRAGKTPLSIYLAMLGWKVANAPLATEIEPRPELFEVERHKVIGLKIDPDRLLDHRKHRQEHLGVSKQSNYTNLAKLYEEVEFAKKVFRKGGFRTLNVTRAPVEASADKIVKWLSRYKDE